MKYFLLILIISLAACSPDKLPNDTIITPPLVVTPPPIVTPPLSLPEWTQIPDAIFEKSLVDLGIDDALDGKVLTSKVSGLTTLRLEHMRIKDITGIQSFIALENLFLWDNDFTTIDLSQNTKLKILGLSECPLDKVDLSKNTELVEIDFQNDNKRIDDPTYPYGKTLGIKELDLTYNTKMERIYIWMTRITTLDVSMCPRLDNLWIGLGHHIKRLDLSKNPMLDVLVADRGELEYLNIKGTNNNGVPRTCNTQYNPNLKEILVTSVSRINTWRNTTINQGKNLVSEAWYAKDDQTQYVE
jgi:hypothetical protein